ncbi:LOW QUALITY PROTEIN: hypothetical protein CVT25_007158 [Psilocybe cyanescens]|uniref:Uncharacterized protein n=1 Tax=Psilocybe cyanescens TaxID=93625 RepID=A0A409WVP7_PSICY|nr:LOW QUALITY PROTEIN: hypothetical protein CVT25_007158 [Psilocybe cyanescens]
MPGSLEGIGEEHETSKELHAVRSSPDIQTHEKQADEQKASHRYLDQTSIIRQMLGHRSNGEDALALTARTGFASITQQDPENQDNSDLHKLMPSFNHLAKILAESGRLCLSDFTPRSSIRDLVGKNQVLKPAKPNLI